MLELPVEFNADKAEASFENGVLTLRVPKSEATKPKQVPVKSQQSQLPQQAKRESGNGRDSANKQETSKQETNKQETSKQETREPAAAGSKSSGGSGAQG
jgi:hypothetical protein